MTIRIANAPCSWGVLEFDLDGEAPGFEQVLDEMQATGYEGTELGDWDFMPTDPAALKDELDARQLEMLAAFVPVDLSDPEAHASGVEVALRTAKLLAAVAENPFIVLADDNGKNTTRTQHAGRIKPEHGLTDEQWEIFAQGSQHVAHAVYDHTGVRTVFHHHCSGFVETPAEVEKLLSMTDPDVLGLCFDAGHYMFGGGDPVAGLRKHANRIWHVHFKDCHPEIAAQIVTGVGFLGAGAVIQTKKVVHGLTTAATIWMVAAVGMAAATDLYLMGVATTILTTGVLLFLGPLSTWMAAKSELRQHRHQELYQRIVEKGKEKHKNN
jgi:inosose dehydratase